MNTKQTVNITDIQHLGNADLTAEFAPSLNREGVGDMLKETYVTGVFVSRQGECYHNGKKINVQRRQTYGKKGGKTTFIVIKNHGKSKCFSFAKLIASAFMEGYDWQNDRIVYKDGDSFNCDIENLLIVKPADFSKYSRIVQMNEAKRINREQMKAEMDAHGFVWRKCSEPFLECTSEGLFRYKGFPVNSYTRVMKRNHGKECKHRYLCLNIDGCRGGRNKRITASKMIASAWKVGYDPETDFIAYKDGNPANIRLDNLVIVNEKDYNKYVTRNSHSKGITQVEKYDERLQTALAVQHDSAMAVRFLQTGDYTEINAHVEKVVIPKLREYLIYRKRQSESLATYLLTSNLHYLTDTIMKEKILSMTTPTARKEHICAVCGKPIAKGEQYFNVVVRVDGKLTSRKTHYTCHYSEEKPLTPSKVDELAKTNTPVTEGQFKEAVKDDVKMMLETFSFQENMEIVFTPLIITECAWHYALKAVKMAAERRIPQTVKLSRTVKMLREEYLKDISKDLDSKHRSKFMDETDNFMKECSYDFTILWYTLNQSLKSNAYDLPYLDVRTEAFCAVVMCELLKKHNKRITNLIGERTGNFIDYTNPKTNALRECMEAYIEPAEINLAGHVETALAIFDKNLKKIKFNLT